MRWRDFWDLLKTAAAGWYNDNCLRFGAALSFYTLFAISPLLLIAIFVASLWFERKTVQGHLFQELGGLVGMRSAEAIQTVLEAGAGGDRGVMASTVAIGTLLLLSSGVFVELQVALNTIWGVRPKEGAGLRGFIKTRLLSFSIVLGVGFLLLVSLVISAVLSALTKYLSGLWPGLEVPSLLVHSGVSILVITLMFAMIFKVLPDVRIAWRDVWIGAVATAVLFTAGKFLIGLYLGRGAVVSAYGAAGSLVLFLLWVYYSSQILFFGAEITQVFANRYGTRFRPKAHAEWIQPRDEAVQAKVDERRERQKTDVDEL